MVAAAMAVVAETAARVELAALARVAAAHMIRHCSSVNGFMRPETVAMVVVVEMAAAAAAVPAERQ